jgi:hypothetical protein
MHAQRTESCKRGETSVPAGVDRCVAAVRFESVAFGRCVHAFAISRVGRRGSRAKIGWPSTTPLLFIRGDRKTRVARHATIVAGLIRGEERTTQRRIVFGNCGRHAGEAREVLRRRAARRGERDAARRRGSAAVGGVACAVRRAQRAVDGVRAGVAVAHERNLIGEAIACEHTARRLRCCWRRCDACLSLADSVLAEVVRRLSRAIIRVRRAFAAQASSCGSAPDRKREHAREQKERKERAAVRPARSRRDVNAGQRTVRASHTEPIRNA